MTALPVNVYDFLHSRPLAFRFVKTCLRLHDSFGRFINQGKGMLQPHQLLAEYAAAFSEADREKLKDGAFEDVIKAAQVYKLDDDTFSFIPPIHLFS